MSGRFVFNHELWNLGNKIEDAVRPKLNECFGCDLQRSDDIFDIIDFKDNDKKIAVEVKGRRIPSTQYNDTIITTNKITTGWKMVEEGWKVYYIFVFTDKILCHKLTGEEFWKVKLTGTHHIEHYLIPIGELKDLEEFETNTEPEPEQE